MSTELDRLKAWMERNGYDHDGARLSEAMNYRANIVGGTLLGKRPIGVSFKWRFSRRIGESASLEVFGISFSGYLTEKEATPSQYAAHQAVARARARGELLPASSYPCHGCNKPADRHHHQSYHPNDHLCVVPLCHSCHGKVHWGRLDVTFGVVPTAVGLIRIAIAGL